MAGILAGQGFAPILYFACRDDFVGQVGNLRPIVNRPSGITFTNARAVCGLQHGILSRSSQASETKIEADQWVRRIQVAAYCLQIRNQLSRSVTPSRSKARC